MSWYDWVKTAGIVTALIVAAVATDGVALISKSYWHSIQPTSSLKKLTNLSELAALKKDL